MVQPDPTTPGWTLDPDLALTDPGWRAALGPILAEPQQRTLVQWLNQRAAGGRAAVSARRVCVQSA